MFCFLVLFSHPRVLDRLSILIGTADILLREKPVCLLDEKGTIYSHSISGAFRFRDFQI